MVRINPPQPQRALAAIDDVVSHDGSSFAVKTTLPKDLPEWVNPNAEVDITHFATPLPKQLTVQ